MIDDRVREYLFPVRIPVAEGVCDPEDLLGECELQIATMESRTVRIAGGGFVILDFGRELYGGIRILTKNCRAGARENAQLPVRIRFGESLTECCAELGEKHATNDHALRDFLWQVGPHSDTEVGNTGFRFVRIDFPEREATCLVKAIVAVSVHRSLEPAGSFLCDDPVVNDIYRTAAYTCMLNMQSMLWDGVKRDKLVWIGDMHPEMLTIRCLFGYDRCIDEGLRHAVSRFPLPEFINLKPSYSLWFVLILRDWFLQNGDLAVVREHIGYVEDLFRLLDGMVDENGRMSLRGYFFDWPTHDSDNSNIGGSADSRIGVRSLFFLALDAAAELMRAVGRDASYTENLKSRLLRYRPPQAVRKQALAFSVLSGQRAFDSSVFSRLTEGGARGFSSFMAYYILKVIASEDVGRAVELLKEYFGGMLSRGATTFWEDFDVDWLIGSGRIDAFPGPGERDIHGDFGQYCYKGFRRSLCHGWASGAVPFLTEQVLGIQILEPGCKKLGIRPRLGNLQWVKGVYPTPFGRVFIECERKGPEEIKVEIDAPPGIEIIKSLVEM